MLGARIPHVTGKPKAKPGELHLNIININNIKNHLFFFVVLYIAFFFEVKEREQTGNFRHLPKGLRTRWSKRKVLHTNNHRQGLRDLARKKHAINNSAWHIAFNYLIQLVPYGLMHNVVEMAVPRWYMIFSLLEHCTKNKY